MARRGSDDEPERPYRWADTPVDPLGSRRIRAPRSRRTWLTWIAVIAVVGVLVYLNQSRSGSTSSPRNGSVPVTLAPPVTTAPPTTPPTVARTEAVPMGGTQTGSGLQLTATGNVTSRRPGLSGDQVLVTTTVTLVNTTTERISYSALDWGLQFPDGRITPPAPTLAADELGLAGAIAPGGSATGTVSFDITAGQPGPYEIHYEPRLLATGTTMLAWSFVLG